ncbi:hypothetical protein SAMN05421820_101848 [Pedobacter steynii]|uniref:Uncharacterized protein n=1 Tax=Pedobacter steynii TaxID=430522 RepID=A0A1G9LE23_9SPHI|nr:hypothetical protein [Pedobacter steynii]NQX38813.1 hypothetical protein [Pedobacter steynii]SDL59765.1 hypothetical protein SAMN05421820_101848 [Pedobacter steynii]
MKTTIAIITSVILSIVFQQAPLSEIGTIKLPVNLDHSDGKQIAAFEKVNFKYLSSTRGLKHIYKIGDILFGFEDFSRPEKLAGSLEDYKERILGEVESIELRKTKETVDIIKHNNTKFLVRKAIREDECYYYFMSDTRAGAGIRGGIQFKKADQQKAEKILNDFLKNIQFNK